MTENANAKSQSPPQPECPVCGGAGWLRQEVPLGDPNFGKLARCPNPVHLVQRLNRLSELSAMNPQDTELRLSNITKNDDNAEMLQCAKKMVKQPYGWLYLWGRSGNAKTVAIKALCNHLALKGLSPVVYIKFSRLINLMRDALNHRAARNKHLSEHGNLDDWLDKGYEARYKQLLSVKVLAIEEFDKANVTAFAEEFRFDFLDDRYEQAVNGDTITMFVSNSDPRELPAALNSRVMDGRFMVVENDGGDSRPMMTEKKQGELTRYWDRD